MGVSSKLVPLRSLCVVMSVCLAQSNLVLVAGNCWCSLQTFEELVGCEMCGRD